MCQAECCHSLARGASSSVTPALPYGRPQAVADATAEIGLALMLAAARRIVAGNRRARAREFDAWWFGQTLTGATLGVVGMGDIGVRVARKAAAAFDMKVCFVLVGKTVGRSFVAN